jgi:triosephosphate isomerase
MVDVTRKKFICGNWKLNKMVGEAVELASGINDALAGEDRSALPTVGVAPVYVALRAVGEALGDGPVGLCAQNGYWEANGAYTGEVSFPMLKDVGCSYVIVGHSERRNLFGETDEMVNKKALAAMETGLTPIVCVGESLETREAGTTQDYVGRQVEAATKGMTTEQVRTIVLAYEPIWAIGTGKTATPEQAQEVHAFIRSLIHEKYGREAAEALVIQYGGSVKPNNAKDLLSRPDVDGALVGGASLKVDSFVDIIRAAL